MLIFYLLMFHHPLQGRRELAFACFDREAERQLFGTEASVHLRSRGRLQRPRPADPCLGSGLLAALPAVHPSDFLRAFTVGLPDPAQRVREGLWRSHLSRLLDGIVCVPAAGEPHR